MSSREQRRALVLSRLMAGEMGLPEAARLLGLHERSIRRLRARMERDGPVGLVHGNRGRPSPRRLSETTRAKVLELSTEAYADVNDTHLSELFAEREDISIGRSSLQRLLRAAGRPSPRRRRAPRHRSRRERMAREGMLLQTDGSQHDWLGDRGPRLTLVGYIDDATGRVTGATFREQEDSAGYLEALAATVGRHGVPGAVYHDRAGIFEPREKTPLTLEEQLIDARIPTQLGRAFAELGIGSSRSSVWPGSMTVLVPTPSWPATCAGTTIASWSPQPIPRRPGARCRRDHGSIGSAASSTAAPWPGTAPSVPGPPSCSCRRSRTAAAGPVRRWSCTSVSTDG